MGHVFSISLSLLLGSVGVDGPNVSSVCLCRCRAES